MVKPKPQEEKYLKIRHSTVVKSNDLIQKSRFSLSLLQQRILLYLISQITPVDDDFKLYEFSIAEFCKVCGISYNGRSYNEIKAIIKEIADKSVWITLEDNKTETLVRWIEKPYINADDGFIRIKLDADMKPYLLQLRENFTQFELIYTLKMKSKYSIRLYELVKSIHFNEFKEYIRSYKVEDLKILLDATGYNTFKDFHQRALKPAVEEINKYTDKNIKYEQIKDGRKTIAICFTIETKDIGDRIKIVSDIDKEFGTNQMTLWDRMGNDTTTTEAGDMNE